MRYANFYSQYVRLGELNTIGETMVFCPFHRNVNSPSMSINLDTGLWKCFGDCDDGGDTYKFAQLYHDINFVSARNHVDRIMNGQDPLFPIPYEKVLKWHGELLKHEPSLKFLQGPKRGLTMETINYFKLGFRNGRIMIPILNYRRQVVNVKKYSPIQQGKRKFIHYEAGYGQCRIYPDDVLRDQNKYLVICEGEWDAMILHQFGIPAITSTGGAGSWASEYNHLLRGKIVFVCYDNDVKGQNAAEVIATRVHAFAKSVHIIKLPLEKDKSDITDFFTLSKHTKKDFHDLMQISYRTKYVPKQEITNGNNTIDADCVKPDTIKVSLSEAAGNATYQDKQIQMNVIVIGKETPPYSIPAVIEFTCSHIERNEKCAVCKIGSSNGKMKMILEPNTTSLNLIKCTDKTQLSEIKSMAGIPKCDLCVMKILENQNVDSLIMTNEILFSLTPVIEGNETNDEHIDHDKQIGYYFSRPGQSKLDSNKSYKINAIRSTDPWRQQICFAVSDAEPLQHTADTFKLTDELIEEMKIFQPAKGQSIKEKFLDIYRDFCDSIISIRGRPDLYIAYDLVYHSVLKFKFLDDGLDKGWLECLVIGDTRTGKTETADSLVRHYQLGEVRTGESSTYAGLVAGLQQIGNKQWILTWGRIPLNDRQLLFIDEMSGIPVEQIGMMSGLRSRGEAEVTKIVTERTWARTRLVWMSNPREENKSLGDYEYGVMSLIPLIGKKEDIARFDFALSCATDEVSLESINTRKATQKDAPSDYTSRLCRSLVLWAWSRSESQVIFETDAAELILQHALKMGKLYSSSIPLVEGANQRIKLAKIAVATAARMFSTDDTYQNIIVKKEHAQFAFDFLNEIYSKKSFDYLGYSARILRDRQISERAVTETKELLRVNEALQQAIRAPYFKINDLTEMMGISMDDARTFISLLSSKRMIESHHYGYKKKITLVNIIRELDRESNRIESILDVDEGN